MNTAKMSVRAGACAAAALLGVSFGAAADCTIVRGNTNDFDQVRADGPVCIGLPNDGRAYCYPTTWTSWMAFLNQNGFPSAMGLGTAMSDWSSAALYDVATARIAEMGVHCDTSPTGGTPTAEGVMDYLEACGLGDRFWFVEVEVDWANATEIVTPHLSVADVRAHMQNAGLVGVTFGWSEPVDGVHVGRGSHVLGVVGLLGDACADATMVLRDPGGGGDGCSQSPFTTTATTFTNVFGTFLRGPEPRFKMLPQVDVYGDHNAFLLAIFALFPMNGAAIPAAETSIVLHRPWQLGSVPMPAVESIPMPSGMLAKAVRYDPSGQGLVVRGSTASTGDRLLWLGFADRTFQEIPDLAPDPGPMVVNRFGEIILVEGGMLACVDPRVVEGTIDPVRLGAVGMEMPIAALATNDMNDLLYGFVHGEPSGFVLYDRDLSLLGGWMLPPWVAVAGRPILAPAAGGAELWLAGSESASLYRFAVGPDGGAILMETVVLPGIAGVDALHVQRSGQLLVLSEGTTREFHFVAGIGWIERADCGFAGLTDLHAFALPSSRSNAPHYASLEDRPDWPPVLPEDLFTPCPGDLDRDGIVAFTDVLLVLSSWGPCDLLCPGDANADHAVDFEDLLAVLSSWGECP